MPDFILDALDFLAYMKAIFLLTWKLDTLTVEGAAWYTKNNNWVPHYGIFDNIFANMYILLVLENT